LDEDADEMINFLPSEQIVTTERQRLGITGNTISNMTSEQYFIFSEDGQSKLARLNFKAQTPFEELKEDELELNCQIQGNKPHSTIKTYRD
jgi:hypothetical protein